MPPSKEETLPDFVPQPKVDERFVVKPRFKGTIVRMLNADGHIDIAHKMGLVSLRSEIIKQWVEETEQTNEEGEKFMSRTRWCITKVTATVRNGSKDITAEAHGVANDRDKFVKQPGYEILVSETRAIKRALANACNITEKFISPDRNAPTRETVDMPLPDDDDEKEKPAIPKDMLRKPDITPPIGSIQRRDDTAPAGGQFDI